MWWSVSCILLRVLGLENLPVRYVAASVDAQKALKARLLSRHREGASIQIDVQAIQTSLFVVGSKTPDLLFLKVQACCRCQTVAANLNLCGATARQHDQKNGQHQLGTQPRAAAVKVQRPENRIVPD